MKHDWKNHLDLKLCCGVSKLPLLAFLKLSYEFGKVCMLYVFKLSFFFAITCMSRLQATVICNTLEKAGRVGWTRWRSTVKVLMNFTIVPHFACMLKKKPSNEWSKLFFIITVPRFDKFFSNLMQISSVLLLFNLFLTNVEQ